MQPFGRSGAWRISVPTPQGVRSRIGEGALRVNRHAAWPVMPEKASMRDVAQGNDGQISCFPVFGP